MAKCYLTGVEHATEELYILDITAARKAVRDMRRQIAAIEQMIRQLHGRDATEVYNPVRKKQTILRQFRLISPTVANALSAASPYAALFITWGEFKAQRREFFAKHYPAEVWHIRKKSSGDPTATAGGV